MDKFEKITISIVVCTLHNLEGLEKCITSVIQQTLKPDEIIIVHGDIDREIEENIAKKIQPLLLSNLITLKYVKTIRSLVMQRNIGIDNAGGDVIVFMDDDVILEKDYFLHLMEVYRQKWNDHIGGVQGTIIEYYGKRAWQFDEIARRIFLLGNLTGKGHLQISANPAFCGHCIKVHRVDIFSGCLMSFRKEVLLRNRFDENFKEFWAFDDIEFSYRISRQFALYHTPFAKLHHLSSTPNYEGYRKINKMLTVNRLYLFYKYFSKSKLNWFLFIWSTFGDLLYWFLVCFKLGSIEPMIGLWEGWKLILSKQVPYLNKDKGGFRE